MIKLEKGVEPAVLARNAVQWTSVVIARLNAGEAPTKAEKSRYNHTDIKQALLKETRRKCAYCESKFRHIAYGDIEHVVPKSGDPTKWFSWQNLTVACDICNTNKSNAPVDGDSFIDPYGVDPEEHFWQMGSMVYARPGCNAAALTERLLDLNRPDLVERRFERLSSLLKILDSIERCDNPDLKGLLWEEFKAESQSKSEYAALSRSLVELARRKLGLQ